MHDIDRTMLELESEGFATNELEGFPFDRESEMELEAAQQFLELESEGELEGFLGNLLSRAAGVVGNVVRNPTVQKTLRTTVHGALNAGIPAVAGAIGKHYFGDQGATWGKRAGKSLASMLGIGEANELEAARRIGRTVLDAARQVEPLLRQGQPVQTAVKNAVASAIGTHLPGMATAAPVAGRPVTIGAHPQSGRWVRENGRVVLLGL